MKKNQQQRILELLQTVNEAQCAGLYADCQEGALVIGEYIESIEGEGTQAVAQLETYCELLFLASSGKTGERQLRKQLVQIENTIKSELSPTRLEIVFLSYKASMSDSLESIYLAAKADPCCDAFWIPIPYYDRKPDGSFGEMHYEGDECYGKNVKCTDFREYDFESHRPDVVFTFNPYDFNNYVTSVHPDFYCERLRNFTDMLVYVPYFVSMGHDIGEHFCTLPGCVCSHRVILQSEKLCNTYISHFKNAYGNKFGKPEEKFIALGSPKFDKVINSRREDFDLPDKWRDLIGNRRVVFYNSSVATILRGNEQYLEKLCSVFETFRTRDDIVLWWRPHPLNETTYKSMRPQLLSRYRQIIADYKREGFGIYDDTPDLHRAVAMSDAYYGDFSSVAALFLITRKPAMQQTVAANNSSATIPVNMYEHNGYIYFTMVGASSFLRLNKTNNLTETLIHGRICGYTAHTSITFHNGIIYLTPCFMPSIIAYDINRGISSEITLREDVPAINMYYSKQYKFIESFVYGDAIFFVGLSYPAIIRYLPETGQVDYYSDWYKHYADTKMVIFNAACIAGTKIVAVGESRSILFFDMESLSFDIYEFDEQTEGFLSVSYDGGNYWLAPIADAPIFCWNPHDGILRECGDYPKDLLRCDRMFNKAAYSNNSLWLFPLNTNQILKLDCNSGKMETVRSFPGAGKAESSHNFAQLDGNVISTSFCRGNGFDLYDINTSGHSEIKVSAGMIPDSAGFVHDDDPAVMYDLVLPENGVCNLNHIINLAKNYNSRNDCTQKAIRECVLSPDGTAGQSIYNYIKQEAGIR